MAKKKENELTYLQYPLPQGGRAGKMTKLDWSGLNYRNTKDTGEISKELNISTHFAPHLTPSEVKRKIKDGLFDQYYDGYDGAVKNWEKDKKPEIFPVDIKYLEGYYVIEGYYEENEEKEDDAGNKTTQIIQKCIYQVYDKEFNLIESVMIIGVPGNYSGASVIRFRYFEKFDNVANISTGTKLLYFPGAYSQNVPEMAILKRHFHDTKENDSRAEAIGRYLADNCTQKGVYYLLECATDKDADGIPLFPGGSGNDNDDYNVKDHSEDNSLVAYTNSGRGGWLTKYYFNIKQPYCIKDGTTGYYGINEATSVKMGKAEKVTGMPDIYYACSAHQRLFGINKTQVFASGYNDYANWALDTATEYSAENAWMSSTQSSDGGKNVGIIAYGGSVFVFKEESTLEIVNTKNPFRINEIFSVGAIDQKGIQVVGNYLIFVSHDGVKLYNGSSLKDIGYKLNIDRVNDVVTGTDGRKFYMSAEINDEDRKRLFVYDSLTGLWAEEDTGEETVTILVPKEETSSERTSEENEEKIEGQEETITRRIEFVGFTKSDDGFLGLTSSGKVFRFNTGDYDHEWFIETDFFTNNSSDIKHIKKVQMLSDIAPGSVLRAYILYDDEEFNPETSQKIFEKENSGNKEIKLPIRVIPRKTANYGFKIRIEGHGFSKLYQMEVEIAGGGEKNISG